MSPTASKKDLVKRVFETPERYFGGRQYDVRIRAETVRSLSEGLKYQKVLDIGCGDGSISLPLAGPQKNFTLLDFSENMLSIARSRIPREFAHNIDVRNEDFMTADLGEGTYDLVICLGVLAHVDSPEDFIARITALMKPGGHLILEFTDSASFAGRMSWFFGGLRRMVAPPRFSVNRLSFAEVLHLVNRQGLRSISQFRYGLPGLPGIEILSHGVRYRLVRSINGTCVKSRNAWWGEEYIWLLTLDGLDNAPSATVRDRKNGN